MISLYQNWCKAQYKSQLQFCKEPYEERRFLIGDVKTSDAKLFLINL